MTKITASAETLIQQASMTANEYFKQAIRDIDEEFGEGYAQKNPNLIGQYMLTSSNDYLSASITSSLQNIVGALENI